MKHQELLKKNQYLLLWVGVDFILKLLQHVNNSFLFS